MKQIRYVVGFKSTNQLAWIGGAALTFEDRETAENNKSVYKCCDIGKANYLLDSGSLCRRISEIDWE